MTVFHDPIGKKNKERKKEIVADFVLYSVPRAENKVLYMRGNCPPM